ncbi:MAG TPA: hypothetical protein VJ672_06545 [Gemmatimonadaceae bacterium]|nr:hypothetical protein [Gemmatimonadaceae bacterium]
MPARHAAFLALLGLTACGPDKGPPVRAEFLMLAGDSTFWVKASRDGIKTRGSPIQLARYGGKFYELYVGDDDRSFYDAVIVGQKVFRRDLVSGDSVAVFEDSTIASFENWYAREHPDDRRLAPNDDPADEPHASATSDLRILSHHGPFLSYEYRADGEIIGSESWHIARRGVIDLRTGKPATLRSLVGDTAAVRVLGLGQSYFVAAVDSVLASRDERARPAIRAIGDFVFDSSSFALVNVDRAPAIEFVVPGRRGDAEGLTLPLPPIQVTSPPWWSQVADALPIGKHVSEDEDRWIGTDYTVVARYEGPDRARVALIDTLGQEWHVGRVPSPAWRVYRLESALDSVARTALNRAFDEAALYDAEARTAYASPVRRPRMTLASNR